MLNEDIHSCSWYCDKPECIKQQRDEMRDMMEHKQGGNIEYYRGMAEPDPVETIKPLDPTAKVTIPDEKKPTIEQLLIHLIEVQINLTNTMNDVAMSNYALVQAMAGEDEEDGEEGSRYQTLGGEEP